MRPWSHAVLATVIVMASIGASLPAARADMVVTQSTAPEYKKGDHIPGATIEGLPPGTQVQVLDGGKSKTFYGPGASANLPLGGMRGFKRKWQQN